MATPNIGSAIALGNIAQAPRNQSFTNAILNKQRMDLANQAREAKRQAELEKTRQDIAKTFDFKTDGVLPVYQDDVRDIASAGMAAGMTETDPIRRNAIKQKTQLELDNIKYQNDQLSANLAAARTNGILPKEIIDVVYSPRNEANKKYETLIKNKPEYAALLTKGEGGAWNLNNVVAMPMNTILGDAATRLKQTAIADKSKTVNIGGGQNQFTLTAEPQALAQEAQAIASSKDWAANVILNDPKGYEKYFDKAVNNAKQIAAQTGVEPTKDEVQQAAVLEYTANALREKATYTERKGQPTPAKFEFGFTQGGGYKTPNKWSMVPAKTQHGRDLQGIVDRFNAAHKGANQTVEKMFGNVNTATDDFDEVILENQDVSENKTFQYPDGSGGLINITPVSIRRQRVGDKVGGWKLVGKRENPKYNPNKSSGPESEKFIDIELPYSSAVRQKTDAILTADTEYVLNEMFPNKPTSKSNSKQGTIQPSGKVVTSAQLKSLVGTKGYEGYDEKELADYYKSQGYTIK